MSKPLDIVILGGGTAGWMAAMALVSFIPRGRCRVRLVESEEIGIVGVGEATLPQIKNFNDSIGVNEAEMMRATKATIKLGIEFVDWGAKGSKYIHPFGVHGPADMAHIFHHRWLRSVLQGGKSGIEDYSFAVQAARHGRFDFPEADSSKIESTYAYAYHFDAGLYSLFLRRLAEQRGATRTEGKVREVVQDPESGDIRSLVLESGETIFGDFFVDCSGFRSLLLDKTLGVGWEDWSKWLVCDRALAVPSENDELTPFTRSTAMEAGWRWRIPLQHRTGNGYVFSSNFIDEDAATDELLRSLETKTLAEPRLLKFQAGRRVVSWEKNCVAIGLSSGFLEPLESTSIYLIQVAALQLLPLLPGNHLDHRLRDEYNRLIDKEYERIRDFLILHYKLNQRDDAEIWRYCAEMEVPDSLSRKIELFRHSAFIERYHGLFSPPSWLSVFIGQGLMPEGYSPFAETMPQDKLDAFLDGLRSEIDDKVQKLPRHDQFIARYCAEAPAESISEEVQL
ncbi:tryptophan halogenase family protein [Altererythrobacter sp.]|uniref:tryptophan halogenase family protein n=1 Tax=Altererythrobacter sp. TaxID=1872480 RepID=UPI003D003B75